jgi:glucokinase
VPDTCVIGIDLGGTKALSGVVSADGTVAHRAFRSVPKPSTTEEVLDLLVVAVREAEEASGLNAAAVGVGIPSLVDQRSGTAGATVHLPLGGVAVRDILSERLGVPVAIDNDATAAMLAEHRAGAAVGTQTAVLLTVGTGVGGGLVTGGEVMRGYSGAAGEIGHMSIDPMGPACNGDCPNRGCLETYVSGTALGRRVREVAATNPDSAIAKAARDGRVLDGALATELAHDGDPLATEILTEMGTMLGVAIANLVNLLNPEVVVLGGGAMAAGELLLGPACSTAKTRALSPSRDQVQIVATHFGDAAGMVGAGLLAHEAIR